MQPSDGPSTRFHPVLVAIVSACLFGALAALIALSVQRPLWYDETMAMVNYPVANASGLIEPLHWYSQAAPALFNLIGSIVIALTPAAARTVVFLLVFSGLCMAAGATYRKAWAIALVAGFMLASPFLVAYATSFKYYGLEVAGSAVIVAWFVTRTGRDPLRAADVAILLAGMLCGIATIVVAVLALLLNALAIVRTGRAPRTSDIGLSAAFLLAAMLYYGSIRYGTSIQMANFPDVYDQRGPARVVKFLGSIRRMIGDPALPLVLVAAAIAGTNRSERSVRLAVLGGVAFTAFAVLSVAGAYPATTDRHVAWACAFVLFVVGQAIEVLLRPDRLSPSTRVIGAIALALTALLAAVPNLQRLMRADTGALEDNDRLVAWLAQQPPGPVALWIGAQPMVQFYRERVPALDRHGYLGWRDAASMKVPRRFLTPGFLAQPYARIAGAVETRREGPGSYATADIVYRIRNDYRAPAASLIGEARRFGSFHVVASHLDYDATFPESRVRRDALLGALREAGCRYRMVLKVKGGFVLAVRC